MKKKSHQRVAGVNDSSNLHYTIKLLKMLIFINIVPYTRGTQLGVAAFVAVFTDKITQTQEEHGVLRTNIMKYRL